MSICCLELAKTGSKIQKPKIRKSFLECKGIKLTIPSPLNRKTVSL